MSEIVILAVCFQLKQLKKATWKKIQAWTELEPMKGILLEIKFH